MADKPIIFSSAMVRALLEGRKFQTRRILKPQPPTPEQFPGSVFGFDRSVAEGVKVYSLNDLDRLPKHPTKWDLCGSVGVARDAGFPTTYHAPYAVGDRVWVREAWATWMHAPSLPLGMGGRLSTDPGQVAYKATDPEWDALMADRASLREFAAKRENGRTGNWVVRSPIHMPRAFSRLTLTVTEVRVQRLQDISEEDARAEGATMRPACSGFRQQRDGWSMDWSRVGQPSKYARTGVLSEADIALGSARHAFGAFINELHDPRWNLNGDGIWGENPWCVALTFTVTPANLNSLPEVSRV